MLRDKRLPASIFFVVTLLALVVARARAWRYAGVIPGISANQRAYRLRRLGRLALERAW